MKAELHIVSTPIGNYEDMTLRGLRLLKEADFIICEEYKAARRLLSEYNIEKELLSLNEHNEEEGVNDIVLRLLNGEKAVLISDAGTPLFSDPGHLLVDLCISQGVKIIPVPGANSLLPALVASGIDIEKFYYYGWLSPKKEERRRELLNIKRMNELIVIMETPYRLKQLLSDIIKVIGEKVRVVLAYKLTMKEERFYRGTAGEVLKIAEKEQLKGEFVLLLNLRKESGR
jgi:16S rRNA (cytidine1402-2'-O)-methyltransferase